MAFDYQICRELFLNAIHAVLEADGDYITSIERTTRGDLPINGLSLEIYPWHEYCTLSIRLSSDKNCYNPVDWQHFEFAPSTSDQISQLCAVAEYAAEVYVPLLEEQPSKARDLAHLIFLAGAEALLNESVAQRLRAFEIDAPTIGNRLQALTLLSTWFLTQMKQSVQTIVKY